MTVPSSGQGPIIVHQGARSVEVPTTLMHVDSPKPARQSRATTVASRDTRSGNAGNGYHKTGKIPARTGFRPPASLIHGQTSGSSRETDCCRHCNSPQQSAGSAYLWIQICATGANQKHDQYQSFQS